MDFADLREHWKNVPGSIDRLNTQDLTMLDNSTLKCIWENQTSSFDIRGWYYELYRDQLRGKKVLDIGSGLGLDAITFARAGAHITCADISWTNLQIIQRLADIYNLDIKTEYLGEIEDIDKLETYDIIWAQGSLINMPYNETRREIQLLLLHLKVGGRWVELAYPKRRWIREGMIPFQWWGRKTDGGAPWIEWWDLNKLRKAMQPHRMDVVLYFTYHNGHFNWFDLVKRK